MSELQFLEWKKQKIDGGIKIQFAKSLALGNTNEIQLICPLQGKFDWLNRAEKKVNLVQLAAPENVKWYETVKGKAVWSLGCECVGL